MPAPVLQPLASLLRPIAETMVPAATALSDSEFTDLVARIDDRLAGEPAALGRQLKLFVRVLSYLPFLTTGRKFADLPPERRLRFLEGLQDGPVQKLRLGLWGLRTLVFLGYYGHPPLQEPLGWRPRLDGWEGLERERAAGQGGSR